MKRALPNSQGYVTDSPMGTDTCCPGQIVKKAWLTLLLLIMPLFIFAQSVTVTTDKLDYTPGETAYASGTGWPAGVTITLTVEEEAVAQEVPHGDVISYAVADEDGNFANVEIYHFDETDLGNSFTLTASDAFGNVAVTYFTDAGGGPNLAKLEQWGNGQLATPPITPTGWVTGNVVPSKAHYSEGTTLPYRVEAIDLTAGVTYNITFGWDTQKSGKHTLDFLTSYDLDRDHDLFGHTIEPIDILGGTSLDGLVLGSDYDEYYFNIPVPTQLDGNPAASADINSILASDRRLKMFGGQITNAVYVREDPLTAGATTESHLKVTFVAERETVVMAWGANIAKRSVWGIGESASAVTGSPYHTYTVDCTGPDPGNPDDDLDGCGNKEVQLSAAAVESPPTCDIQGPIEACEGEELVYTALTDADTYEWAIINNNTGATIVGSNIGSTVTVNSGNTDGIFEVQLTVFKTLTGGTIESICSTVTTVNPSPTANPATLSLCDDGDGLVDFTLTDADATVSGSQTGVTVSYHPSQIDADNGTNELTGPYPSSGETIYARVVDDATGCYATSIVTLVVSPLPSCLISGSELVCPNESGLVYSGPVGMDTYSWSISGNGVIVGSTTGQTVTVDAGGTCGEDFVLTLDVSLNGCTSFCNLTISVEDDTPPVIVVPADLTVDCEVGAWGLATATDICDADPDITFVDVEDLDDCGLGTITRTWTATDDCGNKSTGVQVMTIQDVTPPVIVVPADLTVDCEVGAWGLATATDICDADPVITFADVPDLDDCGLGTITRTWTATDCAGNISTGVQVMTIQDVTPPVITVPADLTVDCEVGAWGLATATDICDADPVITFADVSDLDDCGLGTITRTWTATDCAGNISTGVQVMTIQDVTPPVITVPADLTVDCEVGAWGLATATDICDADPVITFADVSDLDDCGLGTITRTWTATDCAGNISTGVQVMTIQDVTPPVITVPADLTVDCEVGAWGLATATDICDADPDITFVDVEDLDDCGLGTITRTWTATDCAGNKSTGVQVMTIQDVTPPVITVPADLTVDCEVGAWGLATATDICDADPDITFVDVEDLDDCGLGTITRTWTATDCAGNKSTGVQEMTIQDVTPPVIVVPADLTVDCEVGAWGLATATDICDADPVITFADVSDLDDCGLGTITRTWTATDCAGNISTGVQVMTIQDVTPPVITVPADLTVDCEVGAWGLATATDICDADPVITFADVSDLDDCGLGTITRTWTATDCAGNISTGVQVMTIQDVTPPVITVPADLTVDCEVGAWGLATATDICDADPDITFVDVEDLDDCGLGTITRTWTATDCAGNKSTGVQVMTIQDVTPPVITVPADLTVDCEVGAWGLATATDICDADPDITFVDVEDLDDCGLGTITRTWTATDCAGNISTGVQVMTIQDVTPPVITVPADLTVDCEVGAWGLATATDICDADPVITFADVSDLDDCGLGTITRTWTATDCAGNISTGVQEMTIQDVTPPVITVPADLTVDCEVGAWGLATATDICDADPDITFVDVEDLDDCGLGTITRTWTATDCAGNKSTGVQVMTIQDVTPPVITVPADLTVDCEVGAWGLATATDICDADPDITFVDVEDLDDCGLGTITRTWTATDCAGNKSTGVQEMTIQDVTPPVITVPADLTVDCEVGAWGLATATDICDADPDITFVDVEDLDDCGLGTITRTWTATDCAGNISTGVQVMTIQDVTPPVITVPADLTVDCEVGAWGLATATDICDADPVITFADVSDLDDCGLGTITRTWTATDCAGNISTGVQVMTIQDVTPPVITVPADLTVDCEVGAWGLATATDICDADPDITFADVSDLDDCGLGTITRTWTATDCAGNISTGVQVMTIQDVTPPVITVPADLTVDCEVGAWGLATATDICDADPVITFADVSDLDDCGLGTITRTWTATDCAGNKSTGVQEMTIQDVTPPVITVPADLTVDCEVGAWGLATATDICDADPVITFADVSDLDDCGLGTITRTWTATDCAGNISTGVQVMTIKDETPPVITVDATKDLDCGVDIVFDTPNISDICDSDPNVIVTTVPDLDGCGNGTIVRTWTATDCAGNSAIASQTITIDNCAYFTLDKTTAGGDPLTDTWGFYISTGGWEGPKVAEASGYSGTMFNAEMLDPGMTYTVCETGILPAWGAVWYWDALGTGNPEAEITYNNNGGFYYPNGNNGDNSIKCVDIGFATYFPLTQNELVYPGSPCTLKFLVHNQHPGGEAKTPGFWKNWNSCSGGNQDWILDDYLENPGYTIGLVLVGEGDCEVAKMILDQRTVDGKKKASDAAYTLAMTLLAYELNQTSGAYGCALAEQAAVEARDLLLAIEFNADGTFLRPKGKNSGDYSYALDLARILDDYNNNYNLKEKDDMEYLDCEAKLSAVIARIANGSENDDGFETLVDPSREIQINAYPNPYRDFANFEFSVPFDGRASLDIYTIEGKHVINLYNDNVAEGVVYKAFLNAATLPGAMYLYKLTTDKGVKYGSIIPINK